MIKKLLSLFWIAFGVISIANAQKKMETFIAQYKALHGVQIYFGKYDTKLSTLTVPDDITDFNQLNNFLNNHEFHLIQYQPDQWIVLPADYASINIEQWRKQQLEKNKHLASKNNYPNKKVIGNELNYKPSKMVTLSGKIIEEKSAATVIGATIISEGTELGATSQQDGSFSLTLPHGYHALSIKALALEDEYIHLYVYEDGYIDVALDDRAIDLSEVIVRDKNIDANVSRVVAGVEELSAKEIKKLPAFMGEVDVFKSMLTLPGVSSSGEGVGGLNIRGANSDQNLIVQDDIVFFNASHALGFFSLFHPDLVDDIKLYKGNVPSKYGGRISSLLQTTSKVGDLKQWTLAGGLGLTSSKLSIDGPLVKDRITLSLGTRLSTINWLLDNINVPSVQSSRVNFHDIQGKINFKITDKSSFGIQAINAFDKVKLGEEVKFKYATNAYSAYYKSSIKNRDFLNVRFTKGTYDSNLEDLLFKNPSLFKTGIDYLAGRIDYSLFDGTKNNINFGIELTQYKVNNGDLVPATNESEIITKTTEKENGYEMGIYAEKETKWSSKLTSITGIRFSGFALMGARTLRKYNSDLVFDAKSYIGSEAIPSGSIAHKYPGIEPRLSLNYALSETASIKASYNRMYQYIIQISNSLAASPIDYWKLADNNIKPLSSHTFSLGYFKNFKNNIWETSIETYYRSLKNANDYKDFADLIANDNLEQQLLFGKGQNYGVELSIRKVVGIVTARMGYTYARSLKQIKNEDPINTINFGKWYSSNYDKPHDVQFLFNWNPTKRVSFNVNFNYSTGRPVSAPDGKYNDWNVPGIPVFESRNNYRIPDYHRMDVSMNIFPGYRVDRRWKSSWTLGIYNAYFRRNPYSVYFRQESINALKGNKISILGSAFPFITYNFYIK